MNWFGIKLGISGWEGALAIAACVTLAVSAAGFIIGACLGSLLAWARLGSSRSASAFAGAYITCMRGIPELLIIFLLYYGGSAVLSSAASLFGSDGFVGLPVFATGAFAIGLVSAAYQAEVYRSAFRTIHPGELDAARAVGMLRWKMFVRIIAPQVLRSALPGLGNLWQVILKESALLSSIGLVELLRQSFIGAGSTRRPFDFYLAAGAIYFIIAIISSYGFQYLEQRSRRGLRSLEE